MSKVKAKGNKSTEGKVLKLFKDYYIKGWRRHYNIKGKPDFVFPKKKIAIFLDGCFWHGCKCKTIPQNNREYWLKKIKGNMKRDRLVKRNLEAKGWKVLRIWEHSIKKHPERMVFRVDKRLK